MQEPKSDATPVEMLIRMASESLEQNDKKIALKCAKAAAPYMAKTAQQIIDALEGGRTVDELLEERAALMRKAGVADRLIPARSLLPVRTDAVPKHRKR